MAFSHPRTPCTEDPFNFTLALPSAPGLVAKCEELLNRDDAMVSKDTVDSRESVQTAYHASHTALDGLVVVIRKVQSQERLLERFRRAVGLGRAACSTYVMTVYEQALSADGGIDTSPRLTLCLPEVVPGQNITCATFSIGGNFQRPTTYRPPEFERFLAALGLPNDALLPDKPNYQKLSWAGLSRP